MVAGDQRQFVVQNYYVNGSGRNISAGVSAGGLDCLACVGAHSYSDSIGIPAFVMPNVSTMGIFTL